jgi:hypothetical protein
MFVAKTAKGGAAKPGRGGSAAVDPAPVSSLSMYSDPPNEMLTLEDFEVYAFERLKCKHTCVPTNGCDLVGRIAPEALLRGRRPVEAGVRIKHCRCARQQGAALELHFANM